MASIDSYREFISTFSVEFGFYSNKFSPLFLSALNINKNSSLTYWQKLFFSASVEYKYASSRIYVLRKLFIDTPLSFIDTSVLFLVALFSRRCSSSSFTHLFSTTHLASKKCSGSYHYPEFSSSQSHSHRLFVTHYDSKFLSQGFFYNISNRCLTSPFHHLNFRLVLLGIYLLIRLTFFNFYSFLCKKITFHEFLFDLSTVNRNFYSILVYLAVRNIALINKHVQFFGWGEFHKHQIAFNAGVIAAGAWPRLSTKVGSPLVPVSGNGGSRIPQAADVYMNFGLWGSNIIVEDTLSANIIQSIKYCSLYGVNIKVAQKQRRYSQFCKLNPSPSSTPFPTLITHDTLWDAFSCIYAFTSLYSHIDSLRVRFHPSIDSSDIDFLCNYFSPRLNFDIIESSRESIDSSIYQSSFVVLGSSSYCNLAIKYKKKIFQVINQPSWFYLVPDDLLLDSYSFFDDVSTPPLP